MKPSPILCRRLKTRIPFTTKQVGKGFYRGTNTGSMGAHTQFGHYLIDWRKVRHFVVPNLKNAKLTPFVTSTMVVREELPLDGDGNPYEENYDGAQYLKWWKNENESEYAWMLNQEELQALQEIEANEQTQTSQTSQT